MLDDVSYCDFIKKLEIFTENTSNFVTNLWSLEWLTQLTFAYSHYPLARYNSLLL